MQHGAPRRLLFGFFAALALVLVPPAARAQGPASPDGDDIYSTKVKPIFENRCVACHSCYNAPCQLNLQSYAGAARGAATTNVYDATRLQSVPPTRIGIDAKTPVAWRDKGFHDVLGTGDPGSSLILRLTRLRREHATLQPDRQVANSATCVVEANDRRIGQTENNATLAMPYGLPPLSDAEIGALQDWIADGAQPPHSAIRPERETISPALASEVRTWERFLNEADPRQQLVSRYLYEHLFLANLYFSGDKSGEAKPDAGAGPQFFRLVRSRSACDDGIDEIATRRPTDPPGTKTAIYCLRPVLGALVEKTLIPVELSPAKLERIRTVFFADDWKLTRPHAYAPDEANNPFETFAAIPVRARYQFLLDNAHFHVATFIKGPVCNGSEAVNSIQDQFYVFFLNPDADSMVVSPEHAAAAKDLLVLPGAWGSDVSILQDLPFLTRLVDYREKYRKLRSEGLRTLRPDGYALSDIWDGEGSDPNALLTVFRHDDNAAVFKGTIGDLPKTGFILDYPLFERLVYNLVVNFDVFGNVGHQVLTRVYMDMIRMEAEELFLNFLPPSDRRTLRRHWYKGNLLTDIKLNIVFPLTNQDIPTAVVFKQADHKREFVERVLFERLTPKARGEPDPINWRRLRAPDAVIASVELTPTEQTLRRIASIPAVSATPFARYFPELALLIVRLKDGGSRLFSIVHNREHENVSWIMDEDRRLAPTEDTLTVREGTFGAYPNMLFVVDEADVGAFAEMAAGITSTEDYGKFVDRFGVTRSSEKFWQTYDLANAIARTRQPVDHGLLDLTRYELMRN